MAFAGAYWEGAAKGYGKGIDLDFDAKDAEMVKHLRDNIYHFSSAKNKNELKLLTEAILDKNGKVRTFKEFKIEASKIVDYHRGAWLNAEYNMAIAGGQMASKWIEFEDDDLLKYETVGDARVRPDHQMLDGVIKPKSDPFWDTHYPPNGWLCRCDVDRVPYGSITPDEDISYPDIPKPLRTNLAKTGMIFSDDHPYFDKYNKKETSLVPHNLSGYEKKVKVKVDQKIFSNLKKSVGLIHNKKGAYYNPGTELVNIPFDRRRANSKWYAEAVVYHEFGHAVDWHNGLRFKEEVKDLMEKHRKANRAKRNAKYKEIDERLKKLVVHFTKRNNHDMIEQTYAALDTLMSLNPKFGFGHRPSYWKRSGMKEAEFLAHMFENKFKGNKLFKKVMPELYDDMIKLADEILNDGN